MRDIYFDSLFSLIFARFISDSDSIVLFHENPNLYILHFVLSYRAIDNCYEYYNIPFFHPLWTSEERNFQIWFPIGPRDIFMIIRTHSDVCRIFITVQPSTRMIIYDGVINITRNIFFEKIQQFRARIRSALKDWISESLTRTHRSSLFEPPSKWIFFVISITAYNYYKLLI